MADELDSGSSARKGVWVQLPSSALFFYASPLEDGSETVVFTKVSEPFSIFEIIQIFFELFIVLKYNKEVQLNEMLNTSERGF